ncbi:MAG: prolyl oligopeptidase family serine peptidase [Acidimicrobiia bacterium]|nr:prolyl oligopeptidase family serine peptidase [Acidimicrobiia bacterium]
MTEHAQADRSDADYEWLEEIEGEKALEWVEAISAETLAEFEASPRFAEYQDAALEILEADDRIAFGVIRGDQVYNFWQDAEHIRGLWRRVDRAGYEVDEPAWEIVLDLDELAEAEDANHVWKGASVSADYTRAMVMLSDGGKDAVTVREFDLVACEFVDGGFELPEAKTFVSYVDNDTLLVGTDFGTNLGKDSLTESGYPAIIKRWRRGQALAEAETVHEIDRSWILISPSVQHRAERTYVSVVALPDFFTNEIHLVGDDGTLTTVDLPTDAQFQGFFDGSALAVLRSDWRDLTQGSLIALDLDAGTATCIYQPDERSSVAGAATTLDAVVYAVIENVIGGLYVARPGSDGGSLTSEPVAIDGLGTVSLLSASDDNTECFVSYNDYLTPPSLLAVDVGRATSDLEPRPLRSQPARFDNTGLVAEQRFATSADGTRVPYFVIGDPETPGPKRTLLYGYGGFEVPLTPGYSAVTGRLWLERGNTFVVANIRGGGEYGPSWHQAALKANRHKAFEDFEAVAADLVANGFTDCEHLAISGGSNGGLLVGSVFTRSPDLFAGVICAVPLLDMLRYHLLPAGASWVGEYGDPTDDEMAAYLASYSPFHNVKPDVAYPTVFFVTSTRDDRVHPGHARKMVARMIDQGHDVRYYENTEGGHSAGANLKQQARLSALEYVYLDTVLAD